MHLKTHDVLKMDDEDLRRVMLATVVGTVEQQRIIKSLIGRLDKLETDLKKLTKERK